MKLYLKFIILLLINCVLFNSCRIEKRHYNKGYYFTSGLNKKLNKSDNSKSTKNESKVEEIAEKEVFASSNNKFELGSSSESKQSFFVKYGDDLLIENNKKQKINTDKCDIVTMKNGVDKSAKVIEVNDTEVKYKNCDNIDGPIFVVKKSDIFRITYSNGTIEVFDNQTKAKNEEYVNSKQSNLPTNLPTNVFAILSLIAGILGLFTFLIPILGMFFGGLGFIFGLIALSQIKKNPTSFNGRGLAIAGAICGGIGFALAVLWFLIGLLFLI